jgi:lipoprotein-anchoring transpeptidase ErfK/SrfK
MIWMAWPGTSETMKSVIRAVLIPFVSLSMVLAASLSFGEGRKEIFVYIESQTLEAVEGGETVYTFDIVTGQAEKETTLGTFHISNKHEQYVSKTYGSEMPYTMFFSADGKAIHGTQLATLRSYLHAYVTESVGSQGCVGLTDDNARALFEWTPSGTPVIVLADKP